MDSQTLAGVSTSYIQHQQPQPALQGLHRLLGGSTGLSLHAVDSLRRKEIERYIRDCFTRAYGAQVTAFAPLLLELSCSNNTSGAVGIRPAASGPLFFEHYLDQPVEQVVNNLITHSSEHIGREQIVEIGNMAALRPGAFQLISMLLVSVMVNAGFSYAGFVGTAQLEKIVRQQKFVVQSVAVADPARLGAAAEQWGTYYDTRPNVLLVDLRSTVAVLLQRKLLTGVFQYYAKTIAALSTQLLEFDAVVTNSWTPAK